MRALWMIMLLGAVPAIGWAQGLAAAVVPPAPWAVYGLIAVAIILTVWFIRAVMRGLKAKGPEGERAWSLADALSEEADITDPTAAAGTVAPAKVTVMAASSSRLIALLGSIVILILFFTVGLVAVWNLAMTGEAPSGLQGVMEYILGGATLFIPYGANQVQAGMTAFANKKPTS